MSSEDETQELNKAIDFQNNIVRVVHSDGLKKAYRVPDLGSKTVDELLRAVLEFPACPLHGQTGVGIYEVSYDEGIFGNSVTTSPIVHSMTIKDLSDKWSQTKKKIPNELLIIKEEQQQQQQRPAAIGRKASAIELLTHSNKPPIAILSTTTTTTTTVDPKTRKSTLTKMAIQNMGESVDVRRGSRYTAANIPDQPQEQQQSHQQQPHHQQQDKRKARDSRGSRPLSQFLKSESWKEGFSLDNPHYTKIRKDQQVLISWVNLFLVERNMHISDLHKDIRDGVALINLLEILSGKSVKEYHRKPLTIQEKLQNCDLVLKFFAKLEVNVVDARPKDIYNGNMSVIFGMLFLLIKKENDKKFNRPKKSKRKAIVSIELAKDERFSIEPGALSPIDINISTTTTSTATTTTTTTTTSSPPSLTSISASPSTSPRLPRTPVCRTTSTPLPKPPIATSPRGESTGTPLYRSNTPNRMKPLPIPPNRPSSPIMSPKNNQQGTQQGELTLISPKSTTAVTKPRSAQRGSIRPGLMNEDFHQKVLSGEALPDVTHQQKGTEIHKLIENFEEEISENKPTNNDTVEEILQTSKRLKEMTVVRPPPPVKQHQINLFTIDDDELEALLSDDKYDIGQSFGSIELEFDDHKELLGNTTSTALLLNSQSTSPSTTTEKKDPDEYDTTQTHFDALSFELPHFDTGSFTQRNQDHKEKHKSILSQTLDSLNLNIDFDLQGGADIGWDDF